MQVMLLGGSAAMRSNLRALGQGPSAQVQASMAHPDRLIARAQLASTHPLVTTSHLLDFDLLSIGPCGLSGPCC